MISLLDGGEQLERELASSPEPMMAPAAGSLLLHGALAVLLLTYGFFAGLLHYHLWGSSGSGAIQVNLISALPLPSDQPPNDNVLATDTPSQAPAEPAAKTKHAVDNSTLAITGKNKPKQNTRKSQQHEQQADNLARYGEQTGSSMARSMQPLGYTSGQTTVSDGDFGSRFGWYVDGINRKMTASSFRQEVDPHTPRGSRAYIQFAIHRDGSVSNVQMSINSGSQTLDRACMRAAQRVDTFGALPSQYSQSTVMTSFFCEY
ncbi:MAG: TonB family protein [Terracidiphilus sp.]